MIAPLLLLALVLGGTVAAGTGAEVYEHESVVTAPPPMVAVPIPTPRPAAPTKPHHNKSQPHKLVPVAPVITPPPPPDATPVAPEEPRVVLPSPIEPVPTTEPESPVHLNPVDMARDFAWTIVKGFLWTLLFIGLVWTAIKSVRDVIAIRKSDFPQGAIK